MGKIAKIELYLVSDNNNIDFFFNNYARVWHVNILKDYPNSKYFQMTKLFFFLNW